MLEPVDLGAENDERMARLREALNLGSNFQLVIVQVEPGERRGEVIRRLSGWSERHAVPMLEVIQLAPDESLLARLAPCRQGIVLVGLESSNGDRSARGREICVELNWNRDHLPALVHGPLILIVSQQLQNALFELAPDFYSWRAHTTSITPQDDLPLRPLWEWQAGPEDPQELERMIADVELLQPSPLVEVGRLYARLGRAWALRGEVDKATDAFTRADRCFAQAGALKERMEAWLLHSNIAESQGHHEKAEALQSLALQPALANKDAANSYFDYAFNFLKDTSASEVLAHLRTMLLEVGDSNESVFVMGEAIVLSRVGRWSDAMALLESTIQDGEPKLHPRWRPTFFTVLATVAAAVGRSDDAERYGQTALARASQMGLVDAEVDARATLGRIALSNDHISLAREVLAPDITAESARLNAQLAEVRAYLAMHLDEPAQVDHYFQAALAMYRRSGLTKNVATVALELGKIGILREDWARARSAFESVDGLGDPGQRLWATYGLIRIRFEQGEWSEALAAELADTAQALRAAGDPVLSDSLQAMRGTVLLKLGRLDEARAELTTALAGFEQRGQEHEASLIRDQLARIPETLP